MADTVTCPYCARVLKSRVPIEGFLKIHCLRCHRSFRTRGADTVVLETADLFRNAHAQPQADDQDCVVELDDRASETSASVEVPAAVVRKRSKSPKRRSHRRQRSKPRSHAELSAAVALPQAADDEANSVTVSILLILVVVLGGIVVWLLFTHQRAVEGA